MVSTNKVNVLGIIQARGGSKGIPRKNVRDLIGFPLLAYPIAAALKSNYISRLIISTDDEDIAVIGKSFGAEVPFLRPASLASDEALDFPLFEHALNWLDLHENYRPHIVVQFRPTSPFFPDGFIDQAIESLIFSPKADCVRAVTIPKNNPYKMWRKKSDGFMTPLISNNVIGESYNMPRQKLPEIYWQTGHIDVIRYDTIIKKRSLTGDEILPIIIDPKYCVDIDTEADWINAERFLETHADEIIMPKIISKSLA